MSLDSACPHGIEGGCDECIMRKGMTIQSVLESIMPRRPPQDELADRLCRSELLNAELTRMLAKWLEQADERGVFCCGVHCDDGAEHESTLLCGRTQALLKKARTE